MNIQGLLSECGIDFLEKGTNIGRGNVAISCLYHMDVSKHLNIREEHPYNFRCWSCGESGTFNRLARDLNKAYNVEIEPIKLNNSLRDKPKRPPLVIPYEEFYELSSHDWRYNWLIGTNGRWLPKIAVDNFTPLFSTFRGWKDYVAFYSGEFILGRNLEATGPKWKKIGTYNKFFGEDEIIKNKPETIYITEGLFDTFRFNYGTSIPLLQRDITINTIAILKKKFNWNPSYQLMLDRDVKLPELKKMVRLFTSLGVKANYIEWELIPEELGKDIDEVCVKSGTPYYTRIDEELFF